MKYPTFITKLLPYFTNSLFRECINLSLRKPDPKCITWFRAALNITSKNISSHLAYWSYIFHRCMLGHLPFPSPCLLAISDWHSKRLALHDIFSLLHCSYILYCVCLGHRQIRNSSQLADINFKIKHFLLAVDFSSITETCFGPTMFRPRTLLPKWVQLYKLKFFCSFNID